MKLALHDCITNEVTGHMPPFDVHRVCLYESKSQAQVEIEGHFPEAMTVQATLAGVFLIDPYGGHRPFRVEIAPTTVGDRGKVTYAEKKVVEKTVCRVTVLFLFDPRRAPQPMEVGE